MKNLYSEDAFTGLEAAIVLIAFVVVAAVFSYVVLGAGFFTSQTAQATVHTGVQQASSSMEIVGNVYGLNNSVKTTPALNSINVTVALTAGGTGMDLDQMIVSYRDNNGGYNSSLLGPASSGTCSNAISGATATLNWCIGDRLYGNSNDILEPNEQMVIIVGLPITATANTKFTVNFQPAIGAVLPISRTVPGSINNVQPIY